MTKQQFITRMTEFLKIKKEIDSISYMLMKSPLNEANWQTPIGYTQMEYLFIDTMEVAMGDEHSLITEWVYDLSHKKGELNDLYNKLTTNLHKDEKMDKIRG